MKNKVDKEKLIWIACSAVVFASLCVFFIHSHPMYIYDTDDWTYISHNRIGIPIPMYWNPIKVLPETLMPLLGEIGVNFIMPITGDFIASLAIAVGLFMSILVFSFMYRFGRTVAHIFSLPALTGSMCMIILTLVMFMPFSDPIDTQQYGSAHMFFAGDVNCVLNYIVPAVFNAILVLFLWKNEKMKWLDENKWTSRAFLFLFVYLCIFSNLFHSIISMSFVGAILTEHFAAIFIQKDQRKSIIKSIQRFIVADGAYFILLLVWGLSMLLEVNGERAKWANSTNGGMKLAETLDSFLLGMKGINKFFWLMVFGSVLAGFGIWLFRRVKPVKGDEYDRIYIVMQGRILFAFALTTVYLILVSSKVSPGYARNSMVIWGCMFYLIFLFAVNMAYLLKRMTYISVVMPLGIWVLISMTVVTQNNYREIYNPMIIKQIDEDIIAQITEADQKGETNVTVLVPKYPDEGWPLAISYGGDRIAKTLYYYGITEKLMNVDLEMSEEKNRKFAYPDY